MTGKRIYLIFLSITLLWNVFIVFAPILHNSFGILKTISDFSYTFYSVTCHQIDNRSFHIVGEKYAVCSRCLSIYWSFLFSVIIYPFIKGLNNTKLPSLWLLLIPGLLLFLDAVLDLFGIINNTFISRSITGALIGFILPFYLIPGFYNLFNELFIYFESYKTVKDKK
ncbi:MAG: DUF2085 domain-containing protein [Ignavibacteria bacterium]|jgi:uncharacterized membrane protein